MHKAWLLFITKTALCPIELQSVKGSDTTGDDSSNAADQQKIFIRQNMIIKKMLYEN